MEENQELQGGQGQSRDNNINREEAGTVGNQDLGQFGRDQGNSKDSQQGNWTGTGGYGDTDASAQGNVMPNQSDLNEGDQSDGGSAIGSGLSTGGDVASMFGQDIDDLNLPDADQVAEIRQDAGTIGQDSPDKDVIDTGSRNSAAENSAEATTGKADTEGGYSQYPNSGDLGQVDPGQQNYVEDQDARQAIRAGDFKASEEEAPHFGSSNVSSNEQTTHAENVSGTSEDDEI